MALSSVPADVGCLELLVEGTRATRRLFPVTEGAPAEFTIDGLPLGELRFSAVAYPVACTELPGPAPTWTGDSVSATLVAGQIARVQITLHRPGRAVVGVGFDDTTVIADAAVPAPDAGADVPDAPMACGVGQHLVSDGRCKPILFSDDFEDGVVSPAWALMRKTFVERDGRMYVGDGPRPGFNYGAGGAGRDAILATHIGDATWTDYRLDIDIAVDSPGAFNPYGVLDCTRLMIIDFRVQELPESWNEPAETDYGIGVDLENCNVARRQTVGFGAQQHLYQNGIGCCDRIGRSRSFIDAVTAPPTSTAATTTPWRSPATTSSFGSTTIRFLTTPMTRCPFCRGRCRSLTGGSRSCGSGSSWVGSTTWW